MKVDRHSQREDRGWLLQGSGWFTSRGESEVLALYLNLNVFWGDNDDKFNQVLQFYSMTVRSGKHFR